MRLRSIEVFIRLLFILSWISVIFQIIFIAGGAHRFEALGRTNALLAIVYIVQVCAIPILFAKIKIPTKRFFLLYFVFVLISFGSCVNNQLGAVFVDFVLITLQFIFFFYGWSFGIVLDDEHLVKKVLKENIAISMVLGAVVWALPYDLVSPLFGIFFLSVYACRRFGKQFNWFMLLCAISMNVFWSFGKQTILITMLGVFLVYWPDMKVRERAKVIRAMVPGKIRFIGVIFLLSILGYIQFKFSNAEFGAVRKTELFFENLNFEHSLTVLLAYPQLVYQVVDVSTAGRLYEIILAWQLNAQSALGTLFGSGFGVTLDLSVKNDLAGITSYEFGETRSVQTLFAFLLTRFGLFGLIIGAIGTVKYVFSRHLSGQLSVPFFLCIFLSTLAFSTVFKFPFLGLFWGAMAAEVAKTRFDRRRRSLVTANGHS